MRDASLVLSWLVQQRERHGRVAVQSYVSQAVRLSRAARERGTDLRGVVLVIGSEPLTPAKHAEMAASGAEVFLRYFCSELGSVGVGCVDADEVGDLHLMHDMVAMIRSEAQNGPGGRPFLFTSLLDVMPKVMINASLGDSGIAERRECGCPLGRLGFTTHLRRVHSVRRVTCEGMTVAAAELSRIIDDVLRPRFGGSTLDYQWVEAEGPIGYSHLRLRVAPSLGALDQQALVADVLSEVSRTSGVAASVWRQAGTIVVERRQPRTTLSAKTLPFVRE
jgi:hypothetical protein